MGEQEKKRYPKITKDQIKMLNKLSAMRKRQDYINLCAKLLRDHGCSPTTHLISVDGNIFKKPEYMLNPVKDDNLIVEATK